MAMTKNYLMDMQEFAWHLMLDSELVEGSNDFKAAKALFLFKYPGQEYVWDCALKEYYEYGNDIGC